MFRGTYEHTMTDKGRVSIPAKFREVCKGKYGDDIFIITNSDKCLTAYPLTEWQKIEEKAAKLSEFNQDVNAFVRYLIGGAVDCPLDSQGRILIPQSLRNHAQINKDVVLIGMLTKFEIWASEVWEEVSEISYEEFVKSRNILAEQGL